MPDCDFQPHEKGALCGPDFVAVYAGTSKCEAMTIREVLDGQGGLLVWNLK